MKGHYNVMNKIPLMCIKWTCHFKNQNVRTLAYTPWRHDDCSVVDRHTALPANQISHVLQWCHV